MKHIICMGLTLFCLLLFNTANAPAAPSAQTVTAEGLAPLGSNRSTAREEALAQAVRQAVEQAMGVYVVSETLVKNAQVIKDSILTKSSGFVSGYQILSEKTVAGDMLSIQIQATVSVEPLVDQLAKLGLLRDWTVAVIIAANGPQQKSLETARIKLNEAIVAKGFRVADEQVLVQLHAPQIMQAINQGNYLAAIPVLRDNGVNVLITGKSFTAPGAAMETYGGLKSIMSQGKLDLRAIRVETGEIMAAQSFTGVAGGSTKDMAEAKSIEKAAIDAGVFFVKEIAKLPASVNQNIQLVVNGLSFAREQLFADTLRKITGVRQVKRQAYVNGKAQYEVEFQGKSDLLAQKLSQTTTLKTFAFEITSVFAGKIEAKAK